MFVLCTKEGLPIATAFAASPLLAITAAHNLISTESWTNVEATDTFYLSPKLIKEKDGTFAYADESKQIGVKVRKMNKFRDWAVLQRTDQLSFERYIPLASREDELPSAATDLKMTIYQCPVGLFLNDDEVHVVHVMSKACGVGLIGTDSISFQNGGFSGSCGGPYVFLGKCVAMHVGSFSESLSAQAIMKHNEKAQAEQENVCEDELPKKRKSMTEQEALLESTESLSSTHTSMGDGIILMKRKSLMSFFVQ